MKGVSRAFDSIYYQQQNHPLQKSFTYQPPGSKEWVSFSTEEIVRYSKQLASGLLKLGVQKGDRISIVSYKNQPEWTIVDLATQQLGIINVPVYPTISPAEYEYIFNDAQVKFVFAGAGDLYDKVAKAQKKCSFFTRDLYFR